MPKENRERKAGAGVEDSSVTEVPLVRARDILGELVDNAAIDGERTLITRRGRAVAALVSIADLKRLAAA